MVNCIGKLSLLLKSLRDAWMDMLPISTMSVKRTSPDTENHEQNGYAKVYDDNNIFMTNVDNDNSDTTYTNMRNM